MKPIYLLIPLFVVGIGLATAQTAQVEEGSNTPVVEEQKQKVSIPDGVNIVMSTIDEIKGTVKINPKNTKKLNELGEKLDKNWDLIEKKVEEQYPEDYKNIEESLYPLINEAKKSSPDTKKINTLIPETMDKLIQFKEKVTE